jgi:alpha-beta hydrolase superfamily lysophospholipase
MKPRVITALLPAMIHLASACADDGDANDATTAGESTGADSTKGADTGADDDAPTTAPADTSAAPESSGTDDEGSTGGVPGGCEGADLLANPVDPSQRGPWPVGARTVEIDGLRVEVWYPAEPGSEADAEPIQYDIREALPPSEQDKIADADNPWQPCDCWRDLPPDGAHGPYPVIVFVHGTASFRTQSLPQMVHWASRGFVVMAADHPGLWLADMLGSLCGAGTVPQDLAGNVDSMLAAARGETPELEFLGDRADASRIGMAGHSAGGNAIAAFADTAQVLVPMAAGGADAGTELRSTLVLGGTADSVVAYSQQESGYADSPSPKRFVGITDAGHLSFSEICSLENTAGDDLLTIATDNGVCGAQFAGVLFQCSPDLIADPDAWEIIDYVTSAAFEEVLQCSDPAMAFAELQQRFPAVADFQEE